MLIAYITFVFKNFFHAMFLAFYVNLPQEEQSSSRLVLFGPGIESERYDLLN
jgi:hypothetical protein